MYQLHVRVVKARVKRVATLDTWCAGGQVPNRQAAGQSKWSISMAPYEKIVLFIWLRPKFIDPIDYYQNYYKKIGSIALVGITVIPACSCAESADPIF